MTELNTDKHSALSENTEDSDAYYKQHLCSLFGESAAEYFLNPSSLSKNLPAWYTEMKDSMRDHVSAEALWDSLRQRSACVLKTMENAHMEKQVKRLSVDWQACIHQDRLKRLSQLRFMFHSAQRNQAFSTHLLHQTAPSPLCAVDMSGGGSQYLPAKNTWVKEEGEQISPQKE